MIGQLAKWHAAYAEKGLVVIDIDNGSIDTANAVKKHVDQKGIKYATLWDKAGKVCSTYGVRAYPAQYLIGVDGNVIWESLPSEEEDLKKIEQLIKKELDKVKKEDLQK